MNKLICGIAALLVFVSQGWTQAGTDCKEGSDFVFCGYTNGCYKLNELHSDAVAEKNGDGLSCVQGNCPCATLRDGCTRDYGTLYTNNTVPTEIANSPWGSGSKCTEFNMTAMAGGSESCGYCDYGPITADGGGCHEIWANPSNASLPATCAEAETKCTVTDHGSKVTSCAAVSSSSTTTVSSSSGGTVSETVCTSAEFGGGEPLYCKWSTDGNCDAIDSKYGFIESGANACAEGTCECSVLIANCNSYGFMYTSTTCTTGKVGGKDETAVSLGCCAWATEEGKCYDIMSDDFDYEEDGSTIKATPEQKVTYCKGGSNTFFEGACPDKQGACPLTTSSSSSIITSSSSSEAITPSSSSTSVAASSSSSDATTLSSSSASVTEESSSSSDVELSSSSDAPADKYCVYTSIQKCTSGHSEVDSCDDYEGVSGLVLSTCPGGWKVDDEGDSSSSGTGGDSSSSGGGDTPIVLPQLAHNNALKAMQNAVNLNVTNNAAIQVFDLKGNTVRTLKFAKGNYVVPLAGLPYGLYIVKASSASWKQTITVPVK